MATILIVDDDATAAAALAALLRQQGHETTSAADVGAALRQLRAQHPDLIVLDLSLPRVDGLSLMDAMRDEPGLRHVAVIVHSGRDDGESMTAARELGAVDFVVKGSDPDELCRRITAALARAATIPHAGPAHPDPRPSFATP